MLKQNCALITALAEKVGCAKPAELHRDKYLRLIFMAISEMEPKDYDLCAWQDTFFYLSGHKTDSTDIGTIKNGIINELLYRNFDLRESEGMG